MQNQFLNIKNLKRSLLILALGVCSSILFSELLGVKAQDASNEQCETLKEITTDKTEIRKQIENRLIGQGNSNTDFAISTGERYNSFVAYMTPENDDKYKVSIYLKYPDETNSKVFEREMELERGKLYSLNFKSPTQKQPYQVNFQVNSSNNNAYSIAVSGCQ
jgi:hypothetical protein